MILMYIYSIAVYVSISIYLQAVLGLHCCEDFPLGAVCRVLTAVLLLLWISGPRAFGLQ